MENIKVITISLPIVWEDKVANLKLCNYLLDTLFSLDSIEKHQITPDNTIVLLPEMFSCGFTMNHDMAEECISTNNPLPDKSPSLCWLLNSSQKYGCAIVASVPVTDHGQYYNRAYFVKPEGGYEEYDKRHLFRMSQEINSYKRGAKRSMFEWRGIGISMNICYDLRFPVWSRNQSYTHDTGNTTLFSNDKTGYSYDLLLYCANFPKSRAHLLEPLVRARAIENLAYVAFANCSGNSGGIEYCNSSLFSDYKGNLSTCRLLIETPYTESPVQIIIGDIEPQELSLFREKFPAHLDSDEYHLSL